MIIALSLESGTFPPVQVAGLLQFPVAILSMPVIAGVTVPFTIISFPVPSGPPVPPVASAYP